ncbi:MAG: tetratricopeptide repeat protein [Sphingomonadales bacterium]
MRLIPSYPLAVFVFLLWPGVSAAADFESALAAFDNGNYHKAVREFRALAEDGHAKSQFNLGLMYFRGLGVEEDSEAAKEWALKSARQDYAPAQYTIGVMYSKGAGFEKNPIEAAQWFRRAAEQGHPQAQHDLASLYGEGRGVPRDVVLGHMWFSLAIPNLRGEARAFAQENQQILEARMTEQEIRKARQMAADWVAK